MGASAKRKAIRDERERLFALIAKIDESDGGDGKPALARKNATWETMLHSYDPSPENGWGAAGIDRAVQPGLDSGGGSGNGPQPSDPSHSVLNRRIVEYCCCPDSKFGQQN